LTLDFGSTCSIIDLEQGWLKKMIRNEDNDDLVEGFLKHFDGKMIDTPADIQEIVNEEFWDLLGD